MEITTKPIKPSGTEFLRDGVHAGSVSQTPDDPRVMNPGKWHTAIIPVDGGLVVLNGHFDTEKEAVDAGLDALNKNLTYQELTGIPNVY